MSNRIDACFDKLKQENRKALITFLTAGDPDMETTEKCILEMFDNGSDIIEIGVPFSDPIAEGPTIQKASKRSLDGGTNLDMIFDLVRKVRMQTDKPLLLMMYLNTLYKFGSEKFFGLCKECDIDGVIVPDMPFEERDEIQAQADKYGIYNIFLVAPTSHERIKMIASEAKGFLYIVSSLGVTGTRKEINTDFNYLLEPLKDGSFCPACIGFGISDGAQAKAMASYCDGAIMGSAVVNIIAEHGKDSPKYVGEFIKSVRSGMDN
jgi:tryptophan synthase alpha chain